MPRRGDLLEEEIPDGQERFKALNAELSAQWPVITEKKPPPDDAKEWEGREGKLALLER
jgi:ferredoxin